ncbi:MAG TPA: hypothetical protein VFQ53_00685 [Kofleriaceae bacterium]|nr:hypothetical protein [Kofleriaceae bacterium]
MLGRWLVVAVALVAGLGLAVELWWAFDPDANGTVVSMFSLSNEANVPTWLSSSLLLGCAIAAGTIAASRPPHARHWWGIAIALGWVSLDEAAELHENLGGHLELGGVLYFDWVVWAALVVAVLAAVYWKFVWALPAGTRNRLVAAAAIYIGGALVMELPLGWWTERAGSDSLGYALIDWVEETMEMIGAAFALVTLVAHRRKFVEAA